MATPEPPPAEDPEIAERSGGLAGWQKVAGIIGVAVVVLLVILLATGDHGPSRHGGDAGQGQTTHATDARGHDPPGRRS